MSTETLISFGFDGLGLTTIGETQGVRPSARSIMSSFFSCLACTLPVFSYGTGYGSTAAPPV